MALINMMLLTMWTHQLTLQQHHGVSFCLCNIQWKQIQYWHCMQLAQASLVFLPTVILHRSVELSLQCLLRHAAVLGHVAILPAVVAFALEACLLIDCLSLPFSYSQVHQRMSRRAWR